MRPRTFCLVAALAIAQAATGAKPSGTFTHIDRQFIPAACSNVSGITAGPDGALWFVEETAAKIGRLATDGSITQYSTGQCSGQIIAPGPDGALWFAGSGCDDLGRITSRRNYMVSPTYAKQFAARNCSGSRWCSLVH